MRYERDGFSVESAIKKGRDLPEWYLDRPELPDDDPVVLWAYAAYADLATCRHPGGPIPWTAFALYAQAQALSYDAANALWPVISHMDQVERAWRSKEGKPQNDDEGGEDDGG